jgi:hypothetical protein
MLNRIVRYQVVIKNGFTYKPSIIADQRTSLANVYPLAPLELAP